MTDRCLVVGSTRAECVVVRDAMRKRFARVDSLWLLRQLRSEIFLPSGGHEDAQGSTNFADRYDLVVFLGYPVDDELEGWTNKRPSARFAAFEWHSALQAALLVARCRVVNRGLLMRNNGYSPDGAVALRWMEKIGWAVADRSAAWNGGALRRDFFPAVETYRLRVTALTHVYDTYRALRFPAQHGVDELIRLTQEWLSAESIAGCELTLAASDAGVVLTHASASIGFLAVGAEDVDSLVEGMTA